MEGFITLKICINFALNKKTSSVLIISFLVASILMVGNSNVYAEKECYDIKYEDDEMKMPGTSHGDNKPSEKKAMDMIFKQDATLCEVAFCYDNNECTGELTGHDLKNFYKSVAFESGSEDQQKCLEYRGQLPDHGEPALQLYEIYDCAVDNYKET